MQENKDAALFEDNSQALIARSDAAAVARATQEIQAALVIGQRFPRDEIRAKARIIEACKRRGLAEVSEYEYSRGGTRITGPTIDLLRAIASRWGNLLYGWAEVDRHEGVSSVRCWAWDTQSNSRAERTFQVKHWRDTSGGGYELDDERDIYELLANMAARRVRACLEEVIDSDVVADAVDQCRRTMKDGEKVPLKDRAVQLVTAFAEFGVTQSQIEMRLGNKLEAISENQISSLRRVYKALKDGVGKREDYFKAEGVAPVFANGSAGSPAPAAQPPAPAKVPAGPVASPSAVAALDLQGSGGSPDAPEVSFEAAQPSPAPSPVAPVAPVVEPTNNLRVIRTACKAAKIKEGVLLGFLSEIGLTDGSVGSLEELAMVRGGNLTIEKIINQWSDIRGKILEATGRKE